MCLSKDDVILKTWPDLVDKLYKVVGAGSPPMQMGVIVQEHLEDRRAVVIRMDFPDGSVGIGSMTLDDFNLIHKTINNHLNQ